MPADVDPATGYRRYRRDQLAEARAWPRSGTSSCRCRRSGPSSDADRARGPRPRSSRDERRRLEARTARLQRALHRLSILASSAADPSSTPSQHPRHRRRSPVPTPPPPPDARPRHPPRARRRAVQPRPGTCSRSRTARIAQDDELARRRPTRRAWHWRQVGPRREHGPRPLAAVAASTRCSGAAARPSLPRRAAPTRSLEAGGEGIEDWDARRRGRGHGPRAGRQRRPGGRHRVEAGGPRPPSSRIADAEDRDVDRPRPRDDPRLSPGRRHASGPSSAGPQRPRHAPDRVALGPSPRRRLPDVRCRPGTPARRDRRVRPRHQVLRRRGGEGRCPGRRQRPLPRGPGREDLRARRAVGLRQDHVAQDGQPADRADVGPDPARRRGRRDARRDRAAARASAT